MKISALTDVPHFADIIANRGWTAWWTDSELGEADYRAGLKPMITGDGIPFALVAHDSAHYLGSVLVIENDLEARPQYAPWIAALWVEPEFRSQGIAATLISAAREMANALGHSSCYLCASPQNSPYYIARGFRLIETGVDGLNVFVI
ncbi:MAG: N-acetyltransferase [Cereibacter sphaeroides]|uniref:N-acetyltransferase n=1 Tax=Cereibacter sphaeroides TaxID=1063 RepID=A0A2W5S3Y8_CERSP|nr:MAG: N-acetyltransferase [Cereibacter sphaeroides]